MQGVSEFHFWVHVMAECLDTSLIDRATSWGTTVSEAKAQTTPFSLILMTIACILLAIGSVLLIPVMAGTLLFTSSGAATELIVVGCVLMLAVAFKKTSGNRPRNALQIDYNAGELRLGAERSNGVFLREQVVGFRDISDIYVDTANGDPALCIGIPGNLVTLSFHQANEAGLNSLASKISAARESALRAPIRSRIQSRMRGFEASFNEVKQRIRSRITRPF